MYRDIIPQKNTVVFEKIMLMVLYVEMTFSIETVQNKLQKETYISEQCFY